MQLRLRKILINGVTFIAGLYFFLEYLLPEAAGVGTYHDQISLGIQAVGSMAIGLGVINILKVHGSRIIRTVGGWQNSLALVLGMFIALVVEGVDLRNSLITNNARESVDAVTLFIKLTKEKELPAEQTAEKLTLAETRLRELQQTIPVEFALDKIDSDSKLKDTLLDPLLGKLAEAQTKTGHLVTQYRSAPPEALSKAALEPEYQALSMLLIEAAGLTKQLATAHHDVTLAWRVHRLIMEGFVESLGAAMFALLAFYIANAAYRAFRVRSIEALVMMLAALVVMLGQIPFGPLYIDERLPIWRLWLLEHLSTPAFRAIYFGMAIAGLSMAVRMWLSLESSPISADDVKQHDSGAS